MRDILVTLLVFGSLPFILKRPYIGVLVWSWISYMNPHRLTWGFAYSLPFAQIVAVTLLFSLLISREKKTIPFDGLVAVWLLFVVWISITTLFAINPESAAEYYSRAIKIQIMTFVTMMCMRDFQRIHLLVWVICLSIGFFSLKGGIFTILTAGQFRVYGPAQSFIRENNALALATLMVMPLMYYLYAVSRHKVVRLGWLFTMLMSGASALGSQSRGALLSMISLAGYFWLQSRAKLISGMAICILGVLALIFMPDSWHERMESIRNYQEDPSANSRIVAWKLSINMANARLTGGGFNAYNLRNYAKYLHPVTSAFVAHSIYFSVLGCHGWPGLLMFLLILFLTWRSLSITVRETEDDPAMRSYYILARMLKVSVIVYMTGGAFLSLAYFDLPWHIIAIAVLLRHQVMGHQPRWEVS